MVLFYVTTPSFDTLFVQDTREAIRVDAPLFREFLSAEPDLSRWVGEPGGSPSDHGEIIAARWDADPIQVIDEVKWFERIARWQEPDFP